MAKGKVVAFEGRTKLGPAFVVVNWHKFDWLFYESPKAKALSLEEKVASLIGLKELDHIPEAVEDFIREMGDRSWDVALGQTASLDALKDLMDPAGTVYV